MRRKDIWAAGLALGLGLGMADSTFGQDPSASGSWFTRLFARGSNPAPAGKDEEQPRVVPVVSPATLRAQAEADFLRRLAVCDKLRETALETGDTELASKADLLELRAKDAYVQRINRAGGPVARFDETPPDSHLRTAAGSTSSMAGSRSNLATSEDRK
jgi:hypothetical protein